MHEDFERYKTELDRVRLTAESKKALAESLRRRRTADRPEIRMAVVVSMPPACLPLLRPGICV